MAYWLVKTEPETFSFDDLMRDHTTTWDGVRNHIAKNHLKNMKIGDQVFVYHSGDPRCVVGIATVSKEAFPDVTAREGAWVAVELTYSKPLQTPVLLSSIKQTPALAQIGLVRMGRLSVMPLTEEEFGIILEMGN